MSTPTRETLAARLRELAYELNSDFMRQAADALAATCATCRFAGEFTYAPPGIDPRDPATHDRRQCRALRGVLKPAEATRIEPAWVPMKNPDGSPFGCTLHETARPGADTGTEREG